jgi:ABC-type transporter Mla MlaB component
MREEDRTRVVAGGEMDLACVVALNRAMSEASSRGASVDLDLSAVTFVDSRFTAAVRGWERNLGRDRVSVLLPDDQHLRGLLALRSRIRERFPTRPARIGLRPRNAAAGAHDDNHDRDARHGDVGGVGVGVAR